VEDKINEKDLKKINQIDYFFNPKNLAIIGGGKVNPFTVSNIILSNILAEGYIGKVYIVDIKPQADKIKGLRVYSSIFDVQEEIDLALIIVPASVVEKVVEQCIEANVKAIIIISAGFGESLLYDETGIKLQKRINKLIRSTDTRIVGPNCNGVYSQTCRLNATLGPRIILPPGNVSIVTRGGTAGVMLTMEAGKRNIGLNKYIGIGDESDLNLQDFIYYYEHDTHTKIIGTYTEGIKNVNSFYKILKNVKKPVVFYKSGNTYSGMRAALSHVGAIAGQFTKMIFDNVLEQLRIVKAESIDELLNFVSAVSISPLPKGKKVGIWTPGGSMGVIMTDNLEKVGLEVPQLSKNLIEKLDKLLKVKYWSHNNPVDVTDSYSPQSVDKSIDILLSSDNIDGVVVLIGLLFSKDENYVDFSFINELDDVFQMFIEQLAKRFGQLIKKYNKPIFILADNRGKIASMFKKRGVIILPTFESIAKTYKMLYDQYRYEKNLK